MGEHTVLDALGEYGNDCPICGASTFGYLSKPFCSLDCARIGLERSKDWEGLSVSKRTVLEDRITRENALWKTRSMRSRSAVVARREPLRRVARALAILRRVPMAWLNSGESTDLYLDLERREERLNRLIFLPHHLEHDRCDRGKSCPEHRLIRAITGGLRGV
jgi:hypothetical protein